MPIIRIRKGHQVKISESASENYPVRYKDRIGTVLGVYTDRAIHVQFAKVIFKNRTNPLTVQTQHLNKY